MSRLTLAVMGCVVLGALASGCGIATAPGWRHKIKYTPSSDPDPSIRSDKDGGSIQLAKHEDAIVRVVGPTMTCTGTVIDDDLVLTAHHCLVERGPKGDFSKTLLDAKAIKVELGGDYFAWGEVWGKHIVAPPCGEGGGPGDLAIIVLNRKVVGLSTMTPRLDGPPKVGELATASGFGRCALNGDAIKRKDREGGPVRALTSETLHLDASICPGDSGGPVFAKGSREIIGVVSLAAMDHDEKTRGPAVMARLDAYRSVFAHARLIADGTHSPNELPPLECNGKQ